MEKIKDKFDCHFKDLKAHQDECTLFTGKFSYNVENAPISIQMKLIDLQNDSVLKEAY